MRFSEALILGSTAFPLCKGTFIGTDGAGCLVTAAVRAAGVEPATSDDVALAAFRLWPWLDSQVSPVARIHWPFYTPDKWYFDDAPPPHFRSGVLVWLVEHYDGYQVSVAWIAEQIAALEDYLVQCDAAKAYHDAANRKAREAVTA